MIQPSILQHPEGEARGREKFRTGHSYVFPCTSQLRCSCSSPKYWYIYYRESRVMKIVGVGCGPGMLTEMAIGVISGADLIYGSKRAIETVRPFIGEGCTVQEIRDYRGLGALPTNAVVLSTGDPMLAGLGYLPGEVIPGISSLQLAAARLHLSLTQVSVVVAHGRDHTHAIEKTFLELSRGKVVFLVPDPKFSIPDLAKALVPGYREITMVVLENLGYPEECILMGTPDNPPRTTSELFSLIIGDL